MNSIEEYTDINWIHQNENLSDKLSRQREREKQTIIDSLESKTADARLVTVHQQKCGLSNYFKTADKDEKEVIWKHILMLSAYVDPSNKAKEILKESINKSGSGENEEQFLNTLFEIANSGLTPAEKLIDTFVDKNNNCSDQIFIDNSY